MKHPSILLLPFLVVACSAPEKNAAPAPAVPSTPAETFAQRCSVCHRAYDPASRTAVQWDHDLDRMKDRAGLAPDQVEKVRQWLHENSKK